MLYYIRRCPEKINGNLISIVIFLLLFFLICFFSISYVEQQNMLAFYNRQLQILTADLKKSTSKERGEAEQIKNLERIVDQEKNIIGAEENQIMQYRGLLQEITSSAQYQVYKYFKENIKEYPAIIFSKDQFLFNQKVYFSPGSARLSKESQATLDQIIIPTLNQLESKVPQNLNWALHIEGNTDNKPVDTDLYPSNWYLSTARAAKVIEYLIKKGINPKHLVAMGLGDNNPTADNQTSEGKSQNRRVEFVIGFKN